jgi:hypothetical protein
MKDDKSVQSRKPRIKREKLDRTKEREFKRERVEFMMRINEDTGQIDDNWKSLGYR